MVQYRERWLPAGGTTVVSSKLNSILRGLRMSDVFLSYDSKDRERVRPIVETLTRQGWSVFWDRRIPPGKTWRDVLQVELQGARCVVVAWSNASIKSRWVLEEAEDASTRAILVPVKIQDVLPPLGFRGLQAVDFTDRESARQDSFRRLMGAIAELSGQRPNSAPADKGPTGAGAPLEAGSEPTGGGLEAVDHVAQVRRILKEKGASPLVSATMLLALAKGRFIEEVVENGTPGTSYRKMLDGIIEAGDGDRIRLVQRPTEYIATAGRPYRDEHGRTCREVTLTYSRDGEWVTHTSVHYLERGRWRDDSPAGGVATQG